MKKKTILYRLVAIQMLVILTASCAYQFSSTDKAPYGIQRISIQMFENRTSETGIEAIFANDLIYELTRDGRMRVAPKGQADAVMNGVVRKISVQTITHERSYVALERKVEITVDLILRDRENKVLWSADNLSMSEYYRVGHDKLETEQNRRSAIKDISRKIAQDVYQRLTWGPSATLNRTGKLIPRGLS